jgi:hypothetical protein
MRDKSKLQKVLNELGFESLDHNHFGSTPFFAAVRAKNYEAVKVLLENGIEINNVHHLGLTPLGFAARINQKDLGMILLLLDNGADIKSLPFLGEAEDFMIQAFPTKNDPITVLYQVSEAVKSAEWYKDISKFLTKEQILTHQDLIVSALGTQLADGVEEKYRKFSIENIQKYYSKVNIEDLASHLNANMSHITEEIGSSEQVLIEDSSESPSKVEVEYMGGLDE